jgi:hypothetical protein
MDLLQALYLSIETALNLSIALQASTIITIYTFTNEGWAQTDCLDQGYKTGIFSFLSSKHLFQLDSLYLK